MEETVRNTLVPRSLVMTLNECFYCGSEDPNFIQIERLFGLKACDIHKKSAIRDCNAYMHREKIVKFNDAVNNSIINELIKELQNEFSIIRSNGNIESGWTLKKDYWYNTCQIRCIDNEWTIDCTNHAKKLEKPAKISDFKTIGISSEIVNNAIKVLNEGIYKNDQINFEYCSNNDMSLEYPEADCIYNIPGTTIRFLI